MTVMVAEVYDALLAAGAPEDKARKAAETLAQHESRFARIETELAVLRWMVGFGLIGNAATLNKPFAG
jgi:hypothetical protein